MMSIHTLLFKRGRFNKSICHLRYFIYLYDDLSNNHFYYRLKINTTNDPNITVKEIIQ